MPKKPKRFLVKDLAWPGKVLLNANDSHHLQHVLRLKSGDPCSIADESGRQAGAVVSAVLPSGLVEVTLVTPPAGTQKNFHIIVAQAIPQRGIMDSLVQKAGELGVEFLIPLITSRTQVRIAESALKRVTERWHRIAVEASKQSGNAVTKIGLPENFEKVLERRNEFGNIFLAHPGAEPIDFKSVIAPASQRTLSRNDRRSVLILIGPEGGFSEKEIGEAQAKGACIFSLYRCVLKTETAFVSIVSLFRYLLESDWRVCRPCFRGNDTGID